MIKIRILEVDITILKDIDLDEIYEVTMALKNKGYELQEEKCFYHHRGQHLLYHLVMERCENVP